MFDIKKLGLSLLVGSLPALLLMNQFGKLEGVSFFVGYSLYCVNFFLISLIASSIINRLRSDSEVRGNVLPSWILVVLGMGKLGLLFGCLYYVIVVAMFSKLMLGAGALAALLTTSLMVSRSYLNTIQTET